MRHLFRAAYFRSHHMRRHHIMLAAVAILVAIALMANYYLW
jgi:hypothetical protein